jgi:hypothetical protein
MFSLLHHLDPFQIVSMSRKFLNKYSSFSREILKEFMTEKELKELDKKYSKAKLKRMIKYYENTYKIQ